MAEIVTLARVKEHLRIHESVTDEDGYLQSLILPARRMIEKRTNRTIAGTGADLTGDDLESARQAVLLLIGSWYSNREGATSEARSTPTELPLSVTWIVDSLKKWADD